MSFFDKFQLYGKKDGVESPEPVGVHQSGALRIFLEGVRASVSFTVSTLPNLVISTLPNLVVATMPNLINNPTRPTLLYQGLLAGTDTTIYTAAANWRDIDIRLINVDSSARTATVYLGNPGADNNTVVKAATVPVADRVPVFVPALVSGDKLNAFCDSANKVKVEVWGVSA